MALRQKFQGNATALSEVVSQITDIMDKWAMTNHRMKHQLIAVDGQHIHRPNVRT